ncbi:MAG: hypothetical protein ACM3O4_05160 [Ignavibacteriales bacterium]
MLRLNNKGFAISGILYATLILFLILMLGTLSILASDKFLLDKTKNDLVNELNNEEYIEIVFDYLEMKVDQHYSGALNLLDGVRAYDKNGEELPSINISYETNLDITKNGTYQIEYIASNGKWSASAIRTIVVKYAESALNGANPELTTGMIPVTYNGTNWVKADVNQSWYNYTNKQWANAVTVTSTNRTTLSNAAPGTIIPMSDINTMWVWVPRYKYAIPTGTGARSISIVFESKTVAKSTGTATGTSYRTHPAFTFGTTEVNGIWIGKFETTGAISSPTILPDVASLRSQTVKAMYDASRAMQNNATYGFSTDGNIHMAKDSEWGAVAYLSNSIYGINSEIFINPSSTYITGRGGNTVSQSYTTDTSGTASATLYGYDGKQCSTKTGYVCTGTAQSVYGMSSSTTGNIYGVYDMSGGAWESVMGMHRPTSATSVTDSSGFGATTTIGTLPTSEYWDRYTTTTSTTACSGGICYGSAFSETSNWYSDIAYFVSATNPWSIRGGLNSSVGSAGAFSSNYNNGASSSQLSFRLTQMKQ